MIWYNHRGQKMYFKKLIGNRCYLSPIDVNDAEKFTEWLNDLEVTINLQRYSKSLDLNTEKQKLAELAKDHNYGIIDKENDVLIGMCSFMGIDSLSQAAEVGIFIGNKKYWNKGYGTEALALLLDYGFKALNLHNIGLRVYSFNGRAIKAYEKIGFKITGKRREALLHGKERYDIIIMDILYNEFYENKKIIKMIKENRE
jgi:RimJ/RimL family protein N-acetyltransferase